LDREKQMATTFDVLLVALIALVLIAFLVLIVAYGGNVTNQITVLTNRFQTALITAETEFGNVVANATTIFAGLADVAGQAFSGLVPKIIGTFTLIGNYFSDQLRAIIKQVQNNLFGTTGSISTTIISGMQSAGSAFLTTISQIQNFFTGIYNQILGLVSEAVMFVISFVNAIINQVVNGIADGIIFVIEGIKLIVMDVDQLVTSGLAQIPGLIADVDTFFQGLVGATTQDLNLLFNSIYSFGLSIIDTFQAIPHFTVCILRCFCHYLPLVTCPITCCCTCANCPGNNCNNCNSSGCCGCTTSCFFPANCCHGNCSTTVCFGC
jgi:phage-related protein